MKNSPLLINAVQEITAVKMDKKKIALIHIIKKELSLSDEEYRKILFEAAGVRSSSQLDEEKFRALMRYFVRSRYYSINENGLTLRQKMFIENLAKRLDWTTDHLNNFIHKYYGRKDISSLSRKEAIKLIESLKSISSRVKKDGVKNG